MSNGIHAEPVRICLDCVYERTTTGLKDGRPVVLSLGLWSPRALATDETTGQDRVLVEPLDGGGYTLVTLATFARAFAPVSLKEEESDSADPGQRQHEGGA